MQTFPDNFFSSFLQRYNKLEEKADRLYAAMKQADAEGNSKKHAKLDRHADINAAKMDGMYDTLNLLGYTMRHKSGKRIIIKIKDKEEA